MSFRASADFFGLLDALPYYIGVCNTDGDWLVLNKKLRKMYTDKAQENLTLMFSSIDKWPEVKKLIHRNQTIALLPYHLKKPFENYVAHSTRITMEDWDEIAFLIDFRPRSDELHGFDTTKIQHKENLKHKREMNTVLQQAHTDVLTSVANRLAFNEYIKKQWLLAIRQHREISLLMIDIDDFKMINDRFGHGHGDLVLKTVAQCLAGIISRPADLIARIGGEEFTIVLPESGKDGVSNLARNMLQAVRDLEFRDEDSGKVHKVTISIGGVSYKPLPQDESNELIKRADDALYLAKGNGKDCLIVAE